MSSIIGHELAQRIENGRWCLTTMGHLNLTSKSWLVYSTLLSYFSSTAVYLMVDCSGSIHFKWNCLLLKGLRPVLEGFGVTQCTRAHANSKSNPEAVRPWDLTYCSHKPECIVVVKPDRSVLITIKTWHFQFHPANISILHLKYEYGARSKSRFGFYSYC